MLAPLLAAALLVPITQPKLTQAEAEVRFFRTWIEIERTEVGVSTTNPYRLNGVDFDPDGSACWCRIGELTERRYGAIRLDAVATPMRVDFLSDASAGKPRHVTLGIFKYQGDKFVVATATAAWPEERKLKPGEDYRGRPTDFTSTKANKQTVTTYRAGYYLEQD